jgi:hypothetical protein
MSTKLNSSVTAVTTLILPFFYRRQRYGSKTQPLALAARLREHEVSQAAPAENRTDVIARLSLPGY